MASVHVGVLVAVVCLQDIIARPPKCDCDVAGAVVDTDGVSMCDELTAQCYCKANVEGDRCDKCKAGYFHLSADNPEGCLKCYCSGRADQCNSTEYYNGVLESNAGEMTNKEREERFYIETREPRNTTLIDDNKDGVVAVTTNSVVKQYIIFPSKFLGNKLRFYGGSLQYLFRFNVRGVGTATQEKETDVEFRGGNESLYHMNSKEKIPNEYQSHTILLAETSFFDENTMAGVHVSRSKFLRVLSHLDAISLRTKYNTAQVSFNLFRVSMKTAPPSSRNSSVYSVEQCVCPDGFSGLSCEYCADFPFHLQLAHCFCNCRSSECDASGKCKNCKSNTEGDHCERCVAGFHGDPRKGPCLFGPGSPELNVTVKLDRAEEYPFIDVEAGQSLTITCAGDAPVNWTEPADGSPREYNNETRKYETWLIFGKLVPEDTGPKTCRLESDETKNTTIYIYVNDAKRLFLVKSRHMTIKVVYHKVPAVLPCRVTNSKAQVKFINGNDMTEFTFRSNIGYSKQRGVTVRSPTVHMQGMMYCKAALGSRTDSFSLFVIYLRNDLPPKPFIEAYEGAYRLGDKATLKCQVEAQAVTDLLNVQLSWDYRTKTSGRYMEAPTYRETKDLVRLKKHLTITTLQASDAGAIKCIASRLQEKKITRYRLKILAKCNIEIFPHPNNGPVYFTSLGWMVELKFVVNHHCAPGQESYTWRKGSLVLSSKTTKYRTSHDQRSASLIINNPGQEDDGIYFLTILRPGDLKVIAHKELKYIEPPEVSVVGAHRLYAKGGRYRLVFSVHTTIPHVFETFWFWQPCVVSPCQISSKISWSSVYISKNNFTTTPNIVEFKAVDSGILLYFLRNKYIENVNTTVHILVNDIFSTEANGTDGIELDISPRKVKEGDSFEIKCSANKWAYSFPQVFAELEMSNRKTKLTHTRIKYTDYNNVVLYAVREASLRTHNMYVCRVMVGTEQREIALYRKILVTPKNVRRQRPVIGNRQSDYLVHDSITLNCTVEVGKEVNVSFKWNVPFGICSKISQYTIRSYGYYSNATSECSLRKIQMSHTGNYTCTHKEFNLTSEPFLLKVHEMPSITLRVDKPIINFGWGSRIRELVVFYDQTPPASIIGKWFLNGYELSNDGVKHQVRNDGKTFRLIISGLTEHDAGGYIFVATHKLVYIGEAEVTLQYDEPMEPKLVVLGSAKQADENGYPYVDVGVGSTVDLACTGSKTLQWKLPSVQLVTYDTGDIYNEETEDFKNNLTIVGLVANHTGLYTCFLENTTGINASVYIFVNDPVQLLKTSEPLAVYIYRDDYVILPCLVTSSRVNVVVLDIEKNDTVPFGENVYYRKQEGVIIENPTLAVKGEKVCLATSDSSEEMRAFLIHFAGKRTSPRPDITANDAGEQVFEEGTNVVLTCSVHVNEMESVSLTWSLHPHMNGKVPMRFQKEIVTKKQKYSSKYTEYVMENQLKISGVQKEDGGSYKCTAERNNLRKSRQFSLDVQSHYGLVIMSPVEDDVYFNTTSKEVKLMVDMRPKQMGLMPTFKWRKSNVELRDARRFQSTIGKTRAILTISRPVPEDEGLYELHAVAGTKSQHTAVNVIFEDGGSAMTRQAFGNKACPQTSSGLVVIGGLVVLHYVSIVSVSKRLNVSEM